MEEDIDLLLSHFKEAFTRKEAQEYEYRSSPFRFEDPDRSNLEIARDILRRRTFDPLSPALHELRHAREGDSLSQGEVRKNRIPDTFETMEDLFSSKLEIDEDAWQFDSKGEKWGEKYEKGLFRACGLDIASKDFKKDQKYFKVKLLMSFAKIDHAPTKRLALSELVTEIWAEEFGWEVVKEVTELGRRPAEGESYEELLRTIRDEHLAVNKDKAILKAISRSSDRGQKEKKKSYDPKAPKKPKKNRKEDPTKDRKDSSKGEEKK